MIKNVGKACCGCNACAEKCPQKCIKMLINSEGFYYPSVAEDQCVHCGLCREVCPALYTHSGGDKILFAWGGSARDQDILLNSSSGGIFSLLADSILKKDGCVFGAAFSENYQETQHIQVDSIDHIDLFRGSKYIQSNTQGIFSDVQKKLVDGRKVLFSGTPCQINGLKKYIGENNPNLICVDLICHGTPPASLWQKYQRYLEKRYGGKTDKVCFRDKRHGWNRFGLKEEINGKEIYNDLKKDPYLNMFLKNYCLRESCYQCNVKKNGSGADITLGDFWGVEQTAPDIKNDLGTSIVLVHTLKGLEMFKEILPLTNGREVNAEEAIKGNWAYNHSVSRPRERDVFFQHMQEWTWPKLVKVYGTIPVKKKFRAQLARMKKRLLSRQMRSDNE